MHSIVTTLKYERLLGILTIKILQLWKL